MSMSMLSCGGCGGSRMKLYIPSKDDDSFPTEVMAKCLKCRSKTIIRMEAPPPRMRVEWGPGATGVLCVMPKDSKR